MDQEVLIVEDLPLFRDHIADVISKSASGLKVVGCATGLEEARRLLAEHPRLRLALVDIRLEPTASVEGAAHSIQARKTASGPQVVKALGGARHPVACLAMSFHHEPEYIRAMMSAGALGFLNKEDLSELMEAIQRVLRLDPAREDRYYSSSLADISADLKKQNEYFGITWHRSRGSKMGRRLRVLAGHLKGLSYEAIHEVADCSTGTAHNLTKEMCQKFGCAGRGELVVWATLQGLQHDIQALQSPSGASLNDLHPPL